MTRATKVLIVEDEESYVDALELGLAREGFTTSTARSGPEALLLFDQVSPDLVLLDLMLPGLSGIDVCRQIRLTSRVPVIMVTAKDSELDTVVGLEVGADDYLTKPFDFDELLARIEALIRRGRGYEAKPDPRVAVGDITLDREAMEVRKAGRAVELTAKEFQLLDLLMSAPGKVMSRTRILNKVWGYDSDPLTNVVDVYIRRIRAKLELDPETGPIRTVRGYGYKMEAG